MLTLPNTLLFALVAVALAGCSLAGAWPRTTGVAVDRTAEGTGPISQEAESTAT
jgi:hypothetical protein